MNRPLRNMACACLMLALIVLSGCAAVQREPLPLPEQQHRPPAPPVPPQTSPPVSPPPVAPPVTPPPVRPPPVVSPPTASPPPRVSEPTPPPSPAVVALLDTVDERARAGNLDSAAAVLERALRLEPQNPLLWHRLAALRLQQGQHAQAASLAAKSNALAGRDRQLQASNWAVIAQANEQLGDTNAARLAREKARQLQ